MSAPINYAEAKARKFLALPADAIHTFSNGSEGDCWMDPNCYSCWYWERDGNAGELCAFECALLVNTVSPELATMFGWIRHADKAEKYGEKSAWSPPEQCAKFKARPKRDDGSDDDSPPPPPPDPDQLVLLADPTEDAAVLSKVGVVLEPVLIV